MQYTAWTDGGCEPNPGTGGWGVVLIDEMSKQQTEHYGGELVSTNNRMEMMAIIEAMQRVPEGARLLICSDSQLCINTLSDWMFKWFERGWRKRGSGAKAEIKNLDLVKRAYDLLIVREITFEWVRGHTGVELNERADCLAASGIIALIGEHEYGLRRKLSSLRY